MPMKAMIEVPILDFEARRKKESIAVRTERAGKRRFRGEAGMLQAGRLGAIETRRK
jgi:hypothetical protein